MGHVPQTKRIVASDIARMHWLFIDGWRSHVSGPFDSQYKTQNYRAGDLNITQGNPYFLLGRTKNPVGGDFQVVKRDHVSYSTMGQGLHLSTTTDPMHNGMEHWYGAPNAKRLNVTDGSDEFYLLEPSSMSQLDALGATAISRCLPTNPLFNAAAALGEAREGMPKVSIDSWKSRTSRARSAGQDYLNYEFGWKPLVSDIRNFYNMTQNAKKVLEKYEKESGKLLHRQYHFDPEVTHDVTVHVGTPGAIQGPVPYIDFEVYDYSQGDFGKLVVTQKTSTERWFEGAFTYYLPPVSDKLGRNEALANKILGVRFTPEVAWELTPWSWAADWVSNAGDIAKNISAFNSDGLVMPYAYMMERKVSSVEYLLTDVRLRSYPGLQVFRQTYTMQAKTRRQATPYGFGFDVDLDPRKLAILGALGITRGRR
jgi:hypothetical protein